MMQNIPSVRMVTMNCLHWMDIQYHHHWENLCITGFGQYGDNIISIEIDHASTEENKE